MWPQILVILDFGFWGFWILDFGDFGFWILDLGDFGFWILGISGILEFGFWGFWILDCGDFGSWILDRYVANIYVRPPTPQIWILRLGGWKSLGAKLEANFGFYIRVRRLCTPPRVGGFHEYVDCPWTKKWSQVVFLGSWTFNYWFWSLLARQTPSLGSLRGAQKKWWKEGNFLKEASKSTWFKGMH